MREGLDAPTFELPAENVEQIRAFLDGQSRFKLAVWVRHEQRGIDGPLYDHHLVLAVDDEDWATGDMRALEEGMPLPAFATRETTWIDIYPISEFEPLRSFGIVLWERTEQPATDLDPLDFRFTRERIAVSGDARTRFAELVRDVAPTVVRVHAFHSRLWKGEREVDGSTYLYVGWDESRRGAPDTLRLVHDAAREAGIVHSGGSLGAPVEPPPYATVLYDEALDQ
jgi:hypothetical protein